MHDISQLEAQWKKYKAKKRKPFYIAGIVLFLLGVSLFFLNKSSIDFTALFNTSSSNETKQDTAVNHNDSTANAVSTVLNSGLKHLEANKVKEVHEIKLEVSEEDTLVDIPILDLSGGEKPTVHHSKHNKMNLEIVDTSSISAYRDVEQRFHRSHDIDDAFFLAKSYYNKGLYDKAAYWALETNKLDETHEESLLIFAESKVKMGDKNEGLSILKRYIGKTGSTAARNLLYKIQSNKF